MQVDVLEQADGDCDPGSDQFGRDRRNVNEA